MATHLGLFRGTVSCGCVPNMRTFVTSLHHRNTGVTIIADSGRSGVRGICGTRPRFGKVMSQVLANRVFTRSGPTPSYFLLNVRMFDTAPRGACMFRSSFRKLRTKVASNTAIVNLTAAGAQGTVAKGTRCVVSSFTRVACRGLLAVRHWHCFLRCFDLSFWSLRNGFERQLGKFLIFLSRL